MKSKIKTIIILGAYGQRNLGDEAMLVRVYNELKNDQNIIYCNSANPQETTEKYNIPAFNTSLKKDFWLKIKLFLSASAIVYGGGSILVDLRMNSLGKRTLLIRQFVINLFANISRKKTIYAGVGVENVSQGLSQWLLRQSVKLSSSCYLRDKISLSILEKYKVASYAKLVTDMVLKADLSQTHKPSKPLKILIFPVYRILEFDNFYPEYVQALAKYSIDQAKLGRSITFFPIQIDPNDTFGDRKVLQDITSKLEELQDSGFSKLIEFLDNPNYSPTEFTSFIQKYDLVLTSRFHGLIYALSSNIPCISITEFQKSVGVLNDLGLSNWSLASAQINANNLNCLTDSLLINYDNVSEKILLAKPKLTSKTNEMFENIRTITQF
jgi:polysaccharide pyruvyl transferase WcaK-like protein